jgi:hypothetical protein
MMAPTAKDPMKIVTRKEAERFFREMDVVYSRLEITGGGFRINQTLSNKTILFLEYNAGNQKKTYGLDRRCI